MSANDETKRECAEAIQKAGAYLAAGDHFGALMELSTAQRKAAILYGTAEYANGMEHGKLATDRRWTA
jgi:hypothetical protein